MENMEDMADMADMRPACQAHPMRRRQSYANSASCGYCMFFAALYASPFIGAYVLGRWAYRQGERRGVHYRRQRMCKRAEERDIALRPSKKRQETEINGDRSLLRLPIELRLQIYDLVYSPSAAIIIRDSGHKGHVKGMTFSKTYCPCVSSGCCSYSECVGPVSDGILSLSLTCRQLYAETIAYVYNKNKFHLNEYETIASIPELIPSKHLQSISSLSLNFAVEPLIKSLHLVCRNPSVQANQPSYKFNDARIARRTQWIQLWKLLATTMVQLQRLSVTLNRIAPKGIPRLEQQVCEWVLEPLLVFNQRTTALRSFDVSLGFAWKELVSETERVLAEKAAPKALPFVLKRSLGCIHDFYR